MRAPAVVVAALLALCLAPLAQGMEMNMPLACNNDIESAPWVAWSASGLPQGSSSTVVEIPCGQRILMDLEGDFSFGGLAVNGHLKFAMGKAGVHISTPSVVVQGSLTIGEEANPIDYDVIFTLTGSSDIAYTRGGMTKSLGVKPFAVVGGRVSMHGLDAACPTWASLASTARSDLPPPGHCKLSAFKNGGVEDDSEVWKVQWGTPADPDAAVARSGAKSLRVHDRVASWQGAAQDATGCLMAHANYRLKASFLLPPTAAAVVNGNCDAGCFKIVMKWRVAGKDHWRLLAQQTAFGPGWQSIDQVVTFTDEQAAAELDWISFEVGETAVDFHLDDVSLELESPAADQVIVDSAAAASCWPVGASVAVTSSTLSPLDSERRTIAAVSAEGGKAVLTLDEPLAKVHHGADGGYPAEVMLLSRRIVVEGAADDAAAPLIGGHFIVVHTPGAQKVRGVEFRGMGQQGNLGRYPVHFHMSMDASGSDVTGCSVHSSHQRCVVVHGTHNVSVANNVAYDTRGHCFMLEDGVEMSNSFNGNIGALTRKVSTLISSDETDNSPATFWITNPSNSFSGNVAAGSEGSGYWFEMRTAVRGPSAMTAEAEGMKPHLMDLRLFDGNSAHSNYETGLKTYPGAGYSPTNTATFTNLRSYRNGKSGLFFHNSRNLVVDGAHLAGNQYGADIDRAQSVTIMGCTIVGATAGSADYHSHCAQGKTLYGVKLHQQYWGGPQYWGTQVVDTAFSNLGDAAPACSGSRAIGVDDERLNMFDPRTAVEGLSFDVATTKVVLDDFAGDAAKHVAIHDKDGSLSGSAGFVVSNNDKMAGPGCTLDAAANAYVCPGACFRAVTVTTPREEGVTLEVTGGADGKTEVYEGNSGAIDPAVPDIEYWRRHYAPTLLAGPSYTARFVKGGETYHPVFAEVEVEKTDLGGCGSPIDFTLSRPAPDLSTGVCDTLLDQGFEAVASPQAAFVTLGGDLAVTSDAGGSFVRTTGRTATWHGPGFHLDTRCFLEVGTKYTITARARLSRADGQPPLCATDINKCVHGTIRGRSAPEPFDTNYHTNGASPAAATAGDWAGVSATVTVAERDTTVGSLLLYFEGPEAGTDIDIDDVKIIREVAAPCSGNLIANGDIEADPVFFAPWVRDTGGTLVVKSDGSAYEGDNYLTSYGRTKSWNGPGYHLDVACIEAGTTYLANAVFRLSPGSACIAGTGTCPKLIAKITKDGSPSWRWLGEMGSKEEGAWNRMASHFSFTEAQASAEKIFVYIEGPEGGVDISIDAVQMMKAPPSALPDPTCSNLLPNGDFELLNPFPWSKTGAKMLIGTSGAHAGAGYLQMRERAGSWQGPGAYLSHGCLTEGAQFQVSYQVRMPAGAPCTTSGTGCPKATLRFRTSGGGMSYRGLAQQAGGGADGGWNAHEFTYTVPADLAAGSEAFVYFEGVPAGVDVDYDSMSMTKVN